MVNFKASNVNAKMLLAIAIITVVGFFAVVLKYGFYQNQPSDLNLSKSSANYSLTVDSCVNLTGIDKAKCYFSGGNLNMSLNVCENLSTEERNNCFQGVALSITNKNINSLNTSLNESLNDGLNASLNASIEVCNKMSGGWFYCYINLAAVVVKSHPDAAVFLCNLTSPSDICYGTIGRVLSYYDVDKALEICNSSGAGVCYESVAGVVLKKDLDKAVSICGLVHSEICYTSTAGYIAVNDTDNANNTEKDIDKALSICNEYMDSCSESICGCPHCCHLETAGKVAAVNIKGALRICENLSGINKAHCYYRIIPYVNSTANTTYIEKLCTYMINVWGEDPLIMGYCNDILLPIKKIK